MANHKLRWYSSANLNSPKLTNEFGSLTSLLKACLVNGFGTVYTTSATIVDSNLTLSFENPHGFLVHQIIEISGSDTSEINGTHRVTSVTPTTLTVVVTGLVASTFTTPLSVKLPSLGWDLLYDFENQSVFRTNADTGPNHCLFVRNSLPNGYTDSWAKYANLGLAEGWSEDFNPNGLTNPSVWQNLFPSGTGSGMTLGYNKVFHSTAYDMNYDVGATQGSTNGECEWYLVGDETYYYLLNRTRPNASLGYLVTGMGQYDCIHAGFQYNTFLACMSYHIQVASGTASTSMDFATLSGSARPIYTLSGYNNTNIKELYLTSYSGVVRSGSANILSITGPTNFFKVYVRDANNILMGTLKNYYWLANFRPYRNQQIIKQGSSLYLAISTMVDATDAQFLLKIGED